MVSLLGTLALVGQQGQAKSDRTWDICPYGCVAQTATIAGRVRVTITKTKPKLILAKSQRPLGKLFLDDQDDDYYDDLLDVQVGYRRPELVDQSADVELSDEIKIRLLLACKRALEKYHENWG